MRFGLQKLTLLDYPGKVACTVFSCGCNLRCPFCHNAPLVLGDDSALPVDTEELLTFLTGRRKVLDAVCMTGGEPLLHREIPELLLRIKEMGYLVKLDTNGTLPDALEKVVNSGAVDLVAMDIKNSPAKYQETCGRQVDMAQIRQSVDFLRNGKTGYEFRTTVVDGFHTVEDISAIGEWIAGAAAYYLQSFVDSGDILIHNIPMGAVDDATMREMLDAVLPFVPAAQIRGR